MSLRLRSGASLERGKNKRNEEINKKNHTSVAISCFFIFLGYKGRQGNQKFIMAGLVFYALDSILLLVAQDWLSVAFHGYSGYRIFKGYQALNQIVSKNG